VITCKPATPIRALCLSPRLATLKKELLDAPHTRSTLNSELARESFAVSAGQAPVLRRAQSLACVLERMPAYIRPGELLVGNRSAGLGVMPVQLDAAGGAAGARDLMLDEDAGMRDYYRSLVPREVTDAEEELLAGYPPGCVGGFGHILADYGLVAREGALALADKAHRNGLEFAAQGLGRQADFCRASEIALRAFAAWGRRYGKLAAREAEECAEPVRRQELARIAEVCSQVPALPARDFREALQAIWFGHQAMFVEQQGGSISFGNLDQCLEPFYRADLESGRITRAEAEELLYNFYVKTMENAIWPRENVNFTHMSLGGQDLDGRDLTNDVSWMLLDSLAKVRSTHPLPSVRWHPAIDRDFWLRAVECLGLGLGLPAFFGDDEIVRAMVGSGIPREDAVGYGIVGCVEPAVRGKYHGQTLGGHMNVLKCLELALNDGVSLTSGKRLGPRTGHLSDFSTLEQVFAAYERQVLHACGICHRVVTAAARVQEDLYGYPLMSSFMEGAIENGRDLTLGAAYNNPSVCVSGVTNVVDALRVIDVLAFRRRRRSAAELWTAMRADFAGHEDVWNELKSVPGRFGNGDA
jgi:pyruvate-formate lyase